MKRLWAMLGAVASLALAVACAKEYAGRQVQDFNAGWRFHLGDLSEASAPEFNDSDWRELDLPHDWSIEGEFSPEHPATPGGGALPGGIGWYRKSFTLSEAERSQLVFVEFDGIYRNSEVWINGRYLGRRPYGYISFAYELTPYLRYGGEKNVLAVRVDNSKQPNSRWYSGSGIYRNVRLLFTSPVRVDQWGVFITAPQVTTQSAAVVQRTAVRNGLQQDAAVEVQTILFDPQGKKAAAAKTPVAAAAGAATDVQQELTVKKPLLWSDRSPHLYVSLTRLWVNGRLADEVRTTFGIRRFEFDSEKGFLLNDVPTKIRGVCMHHDLGCLGAAVNGRALERQLEMLKEMGCNAIRTSHNPPAPELLDLCDRMGFLVMDEAFDMWRLKKTEFDYALDFDEWHERDLRDFVRRDRNHPCVILWSIGNEILEQWHESGTALAQELASIVRSEDPTRPITSACNDPQPNNFIIRSGALDVIGYNYHHETFEEFPVMFPGQKFIAAETGSAIATRGAYDMPSDSVRVWPRRWDQPETYNPDYTCSAYDNCRVGWGSTHADTWRLIKRRDYLSGMFYWTGFDYLGEPTPYGWPARSSYFGLIDLAGFPKDAYFFYQAEWSDKPMLHLFPHWNWKEGQTIDLWVYTNLEEVELFLNETSLGKKRKGEDDFQLVWRTVFTPGTVRAVGRKGDVVLQREIRTAGEAAAIRLCADREIIRADGKDLSFVTAEIVDAQGVLVPRADHLVRFVVSGPIEIVGVDNGSQISSEPFKADRRHAFNGKCLVVVRSTGRRGRAEVTASSDGLAGVSVSITLK